VENNGRRHPFDKRVVMARPGERSGAPTSGTSTSPLNSPESSTKIRAVARGQGARRFFGQFEAALSKAKARKRSLLKKLSAFSAVVSELPIPYAGAVAKAAKVAAKRRPANHHGLNRTITGDWASVSCST
jgi:hypothetical protein